jgi:transposase-like protein
MEISAATLSSITDKVIPLVKEWHSRPLEPVYPFVWLDCMHYKVKDEGGPKMRFYLRSRS